MYKSFLIKYGEIAIKGKNRYLFEEALVKQIRYALASAEGAFEVRRRSRPAETATGPKPAAG